MEENLPNQLSDMVHTYFDLVQNDSIENNENGQRKYFWVKGYKAEAVYDDMYNTMGGIGF